MQHNNPLHGFTLQRIVELLLEDAGDFVTLAACLPMRCFQHDPSIKSALSFLRKTPWAREQVEQLFVKQQLYVDSASRSVARLANQPVQPMPAKRPTAKPATDTPRASTKPSHTSSNPPGRTQQPKTTSKQPAKVWTGWTMPAKKP